MKKGTSLLAVVAVAASVFAQAGAVMATNHDYTGRHTMAGEVVKIDQKSGQITLKTPEGKLSLHFPPSALAQMKKGDKVSVELAIKPISSTSLQPDRDKAGSASLAGEKK